MRFVRAILCLAFFVPAFTFMGFASPMPYVGPAIGFALGLLLGLGFGGALPAGVVRVLYGPESDQPPRG